MTMALIDCFLKQYPDFSLGEENKRGKAEKRVHEKLPDGSASFAQTRAEQFYVRGMISPASGAMRFT